MMQIHSRSEWQARSPRSRYTAPQINGIIVHWNGPGMGQYPQSSVPSIMQSTQNYHMDDNGWADIAYNFAINRFGEIWEGRGWDVINAASGDTWANTNLTAVELQLGQGDPFPTAVRLALVDFVRFYQKDMKRARNLYVHKDVALTACPGPEIEHFVHIDLQSLVDAENPTTGEDEMPAFWVNVNGSILGCFNGILRPLYGAEWEYYKQVGIKQLSMSQAELDTLRQWGRA